MHTTTDPRPVTSHALANLPAHPPTRIVRITPKQARDIGIDREIVLPELTDKEMQHASYSGSFASQADLSIRLHNALQRLTSQTARNRRLRAQYGIDSIVREIAHYQMALDICRERVARGTTADYRPIGAGFLI